jgi:hypothetical protein
VTHDEDKSGNRGERQHVMQGRDHFSTLLFAAKPAKPSGLPVINSRYVLYSLFVLVATGICEL